MSGIVSFVSHAVRAAISSLFSQPEKDILRESPAFGAEEWQKNYGLNLKEPSIPHSLQEKLDGVCPFWSPKTIKETHVLCLVPNDLSTHELQGLIVDPSGKKDSYGAHWILITKKTVKATHGLHFEAQEKFLNDNGYEAPSTLETAVAVLAANSQSVEIYPTRAEATRCREEEGNRSHLAVGWDPYIGFAVYSNNWDQNYGMAGVIRE